MVDPQGQVATTLMLSGAFLNRVTVILGDTHFGEIKAM